MSIRNRGLLACLVVALSSPVAADGIGSAIGGASGIGRGIGEGSGIIVPAKLNRIALSATTILAGSANGTTLGTASLLGTHTGTPVWAISDPSGTFTINSSTGVVTVLSNTALTPGNNIPDHNHGDWRGADGAGRKFYHQCNRRRQPPLDRYRLGAAH